MGELQTNISCVFDVKQVATLVSIPESEVISLVEQGGTNGFKIDGKWRITHNELQSFLKNRSRSPSE